MSTSGRLRAGGAFGYLLLVIMLTLGVFAMHTLGHPEESSGHAMGGGAAVAHQDGTAHHASTEKAPAQHDRMAQREPVAPAAALPVHELPGGMDPMSVCVAVLAAGLLALFLKAAVLRRWVERSTALLARSIALARPVGPPPRPLLAQSSVLRI
ncbi:hypothetical protein [Streptomyces sp. NPDC053367]|uniref:hypothetical protein n=1 Tax=Streptomyces sp. NPDC053367 TaxID=3365700 RepID=UPI0037CF8F11